MSCAGEDLLGEVCEEITEPTVHYSRTNPSAPSSMVVDFVRDDNNNNYGFLAYVISGVYTNLTSFQLQSTCQCKALPFKVILPTDEMRRSK